MKEIHLKDITSLKYKDNILSKMYKGDKLIYEKIEDLDLPLDVHHISDKDLKYIDIDNSKFNPDIAFSLFYRYHRFFDLDKNNDKSFQINQYRMRSTYKEVNADDFYFLLSKFGKDFILR